MDSQLLFSAIWVPFIFGSSLALFSSKKGSNAYKWISLAGSLWPFLVAWYLFFQFEDGLQGGYQFEFLKSTGLDSLGIYLHLGLNGISLPLFILAGTVGLAAVFYALHSHADRIQLYLSLLLIMLSGLMGTFASIDLFFFYFFHEFALIPSFIMIMIWGGVARYAIALEMTIYLTLGALLSLVGLIALYQQSGADSFSMLALSNALAERPLTETIESNIFALSFLSWYFGCLCFPFIHGRQRVILRLQVVRLCCMLGC